MTEFMHDPENWVHAGVVIFLLILVFAKVPANLWRSLGETGKAVRAELDEAVRIRQEATELLNAIKAQRQAAEKKAKEIIALAEEEAQRLTEEARTKLADSIKRREELAERKIAQAEARAAADVKAAAAELASQLAESILVERTAGLGADKAVDAAIDQLPGRFS